MSSAPECRRVAALSASLSSRSRANWVSFNPTVLSHKLHATDGMRLTHQEVKAIVRLLAARQAIIRCSQVVDLLDLMDLKPSLFDEGEWASPPLNALEPDARVTPAPPSFSHLVHNHRCAAFAAHAADRAGSADDVAVRTAVRSGCAPAHAYRCGWYRQDAPCARKSRTAARHIIPTG